MSGFNLLAAGLVPAPLNEWLPSDATSAALSLEGIYAVANVTEAADTGAASATLAIVATSNHTQAADTLVSAATLAIAATSNSTEAADSSQASGTLSISTSETATEAGDTLTATAALAIAAVLSINESADSLSAQATGVIAPVETTPPVTATGSGIFEPRRRPFRFERGPLPFPPRTPIRATVSVNELPDTLVASATVSRDNTLQWFLEEDLLLLAAA